MNAFESQNDWDLIMLRFRQTIIGFLIGMFKENNNESMHFDQIQEFMTPYYPYLKKREGTRYLAKIQNSIQGSLFSNPKLFYRDSKGFWKMNVSQNYINFTSSLLIII